MSDEELPVSDLLAARRVTEASPDFWNDLEAQLVDEPAPIASDRMNAITRRGDTIAEVDAAPVFDLTSRRVRRWVIAAAATAAAVAALVAGLGTISDDDPPTITDITTTTTTTTTIAPDQDASPDPADLVVVDVSAEVTPISGLGTAQGLLATPDAVWMKPNDSPSELLRLDPATNDVDARIGIPPSCCDVVATDDAVWVAGVNSLTRVDPETNNVVAELDVPRASPWNNRAAADSGTIWVGRVESFGPSSAGMVIDRIDPTTNGVVATIELPRNQPDVDMAVGDDALWVGGSGFVWRIEAATNTVVATIEVGTGDSDLVVADDAVWVRTERVVYRIDPTTNGIAAEISGPDGFPGFCCDAVEANNSLLVGGWNGRLYRVDTATDTLDAAFDLGLPTPSHLSVAGDTLWFGGQSGDGTTPIADGFGRAPLDVFGPTASTGTASATAPEASLTPASTVSEFASPAGYGAPTRWVDDLTPAAERYAIRWYGVSDDPDDPFRDGDLALVSVPVLSSNVVFAGLDPYRDYDHLSSAFTRRSEAARRVALLSRTLDEDELEELIDTVTIDADQVAFTPPSGYREVAGSRHTSPNGPVHDHNLTVMNYRSFHRADGFWWTEGDVPGGSVWVWSATDAADLLPVAGYFAIESDNVDVGGRPGILGTYHGSMPRVLSFIDDNGILVMVGTDDPSIDLVAMATSVADPANPPRPLEFPPLVHSETDPALSATTVGLEWSVFPRRSGVGVEVCFAHGSLGDEDTGTHCSPGGVVTDWRVQGFNPWNPGEPTPPWSMIEHDGEYWMTYAGRAPDCVTTVEVEGFYTRRKVQVPTVVADDGHRWFMLAVPMATAGTSWEDINVAAVLRGLDADGRLVDASDGLTWLSVDTNCNPV